MKSLPSRIEVDSPCGSKGTATGVSDMRCQRCPKPATLHITEVQGVTDEGAYQFDEFHFCEECARKHLYEPAFGGGKEEGGAEPSTGEPFENLNSQECPQCGLKFKDFRNSGRLGCAHDYTIFREELLPLLENIHGETRHVGKTPRHHGTAVQAKHSESTNLRKLLGQAIQREDYEEAARLRDQVRRLEES